MGGNLKTMIAAFATLLTLTSAAHAEDTTQTKTETMMEKVETKTKEMGESAKVGVKKTAKKTKLMAKKATHRVEEAACMEGDLKCAEKKMEHRADEMKDKIPEQKK